MRSTLTMVSMENMGISMATTTMRHMKNITMRKFHLKR